MEDKQRINLLINILLDINEELGARDDAAIDLGGFIDKDALNALLKVASNPEEDFIADVAGTSIATIWIGLNEFNLEDYKKLIPVAKHEVFDFIQISKPEWINLYNIER